MTDNTQELDELFCNAGLPHPGEDETSAQFKQSLLYWHNKQVEAVLERLSNQTTATFIAPTSGVPLSAIEAECNKLKE